MPTYNHQNRTIPTYNHRYRTIPTNNTYMQYLHTIISIVNMIVFSEPSTSRTVNEQPSREPISMTID